MSERNVEREEEERRGGEDFERKIRGEHARGKNIPGVVSLASVEAGEVAHSAVKRGGVKGAVQRNRESTRPEKDEAAWSRLARSRPSAQQKRDKSSTLIRILPLFALWNTILNGMGAQ